MVPNASINGSWVFTDLSDLYQEAWSNFCEEKTQKCLQNNIEIFKNLSNHIKTTGKMTSLKTYRIKLQSLITQLVKSNRLAKLAPDLKDELPKIIEEKGQDRALQHLTQAIIRILISTQEIFAKKPTDDEAEVVVF